MQPPASNFDDAPLRCVSINDEWVSFVIGALYRLESPLFWSSDQLHGEQELIRLVDSLVVGGCVQPMSYDAYAQVERDAAPNTAGGGYSATEQTYGLTAGFTSDAAKIAINLAFDLVTCVAGVYEISADIVLLANATSLTRAKLMLRDLALPQTHIEGLSVNLAADEQGTLILHGIITLAATTSLTLRLDCSTARATNGLGRTVNKGTREVYGHMRILKLLT